MFCRTLRLTKTPTPFYSRTIRKLTTPPCTFYSRIIYLTSEQWVAAEHTPSRCARLEEAGFDADSIAQIKGPAGADIGAQTAAEIALSMIAEVVAAKHGKL